MKSTLLALLEKEPVGTSGGTAERCKEISHKVFQNYDHVFERVSPPKLGGVAAAKPQTGWFPNRNPSRMHFEALRLWNHPVRAFGAS